MATIFSKIIAGEIPSYKVAEDEKFYAFLDINPLVKGHTLVVPKREVDYIFDLEDSELAEMHVACFCQESGVGNTEGIPMQEGWRSSYWFGSATCTHSPYSYTKGIGYAFLKS